MNLVKIVRKFFRPPKPEPKTYDLTPRQYHVLQLMKEGQSNKEIALTLSISYQTAKNHVSAVMRELDVHTRTKAVLKGLKQGIVNL